MKKLLLILSVLFVVSCSKDPVIYTLTTSANPIEGGAVSPTTKQYEEGETATITATPAAEYLFQSWSGATGSTNSTSVVMSSDKSVTANFVKKKYALTTTVEGEGTVTEKVIRAGAATDYNSGTIVELTAVPSEEWMFVEWTGDITGTENPTQITIDKAKNVTAVFVKKQYPLTIEIEGEGTVTEKVIKQGLATDYNSGTIVELTATPSDEWEFKFWANGLKGTDNPKQITIDRAKTVKAVFVRKDTDGDGVYDYEDNCPDTANADQADTDADGIGDVCDDTDEDGVTDDKDKCPDTPIGDDVNREGCSDSQKVYLADNGVTIKCRSCLIDGEVLELNNERYIVFLYKSTLATYITNYNSTSLKIIIDSNSNSVGAIRNPPVKPWPTEDFDYTSKNISIEHWDTSAFTSLENAFSGKELFNQDISNWDVSNVTNMREAFRGASSFNQDISSWDVSNVTNMYGMFYKASSFNQDIGDWDIRNNIELMNMFYGASSFNQDIGGWTLSDNLSSIRAMFSGASSFNQDISGWNISKVSEGDFQDLFRDSAFNQDISSWDMSGVTNMQGMFLGTPFNQDISKWDVSNVTDMRIMFYNNKNFNQDLREWDVRDVSACSGFFSGASSWTLPKPDFVLCNPN